jgi:hypothetical protein
VSNVILLDKGVAMNVMKAWNYLQNALYQYKGSFELDLWYNAKDDKFEITTDFSYRKKTPYHMVSLGVWSRRASLGDFSRYANGIRLAKSLYDVNELTMYAKSRICNGMGPHGLGWTVPDFAYGAAGDAHDLKYSVGGGDSDRKWADYMFLWHIKRLGGGFIAYVYFWAVRMFGAKAFEFRFKKMSVTELNIAYEIEKKQKGLG